MKKPVMVWIKIVLPCCVKQNVCCDEEEEESLSISS